MSFDIKFTRHILGNPGVTHSVPTALMNAVDTEWVTPGLPRMTRQGFENACCHREACRAIQHMFSKPSLVRREPGILLISLPIVSLFKLAIMT